MQSAESQGKSGPEHAPCSVAVERFGHLLRAIRGEPRGGAGVLGDDQLFCGRLAGEFDRWLRALAPVTPWWQTLQTPPFMESPSWPTQPSDLGCALGADVTAPAPGTQNEVLETGQRASDLMKRWSQLQAQLTTHWMTIVRNAGERFVTRAATVLPAVEVTTAFALYELWIECAEQAYAATVHTDDFCRTQAELINITTTLLLERRRQAEVFAPVADPATRSERERPWPDIAPMRSESRRGSARRTTRGRRQKGKTR